MSIPIRISADKARRKSVAGEALLVCAYDDADKFNANHLEGAVTWQEFEAKMPKLAKGDAVVLYCA